VLHRAVREGWAAMADTRGLPPHVKEEVERFLQCGRPERGFARLACDECGESLLVPFSCKRRGFCARCAARRAHEAAAHADAVLPKLGYRQWTLSLPRQLRWLVLKKPVLLKLVERALMRAVWRWQRHRAKALGQEGKLYGGGLCFTQLFGAQWQLTPHLHALLPEGLWRGEKFEELPPPMDDEVEAVLVRVVRQLEKKLEGLEEVWPEDDYERLQARGAQLTLVDVEEGPHRRRRAAVWKGFSLHASTHVHGNDRQGLLRLVRYGSRGPVAESRLSRRDDGRYEYLAKKGATLVLTAEQLLRRLLWLVPQKGVHLTGWHGVFSAHAKLRPTVMRQAANDNQERRPIAAGTRREKPKRSRIDWSTLLQRTWGCDVWRCPCGGQRRVLELVTSPRRAEEVLRELGRLAPGSPLPQAQAPPQAQLPFAS